MLTAAKACAVNIWLAAILLVAAATMPSHAQHDEQVSAQVLAQAQKQQQPLLKTIERSGALVGRVSATEIARREATNLIRA